MSNEKAVPEIIVASDPSDLAHRAASAFVDRAQSAISGTGMFRVALSGGSTPRLLYETLASEPYRGQIDWGLVQVFFSDERFVPLDSPDSNFHMAWTALLSKVPIPERFVHPYATVDVTPQLSAANYEEGIRRVFAVGLSEIPRFDLILLGLGPDGHTASLFPGTEALSNTTNLVVANFVPKLDSWRLTFTYPLINAAHVVAFLVAGQEKADRVAEVMSGGDLPAARVHPVDGRLIWFLDRAAASRLSSTSVPAQDAEREM